MLLSPAAFAQKTPITFDAGVEFGRTDARMQGADTVLSLTTTSGPATTLTADGVLSYRRLQMTGQGGISFAGPVQGGYARGTTSLRGNTDDGRLSRWSITGDATTMGATGTVSALSAGLSAQFGRLDWLEASGRFGMRWRGAASVPVTSLALSRMWSQTFGRSDVFVLTSLNGTRTSYTGIRQRWVVGTGGAEFGGQAVERTHVSLLDLRIQPQWVRGPFSIAGEGGWRWGRSASVWDDPIWRNETPAPAQVQNPSILFLDSSDRLIVQRERDLRFTAVMRGSVQLNPFVSLNVEGGRRSSDPISGSAGMRYLAMSLRMALPSARVRALDALTNRLHEQREVDHGELMVRSDTAPGVRFITVRSAQGKTIEVAGDFTNWEPVLLTPIHEGPTTPQYTQLGARVTSHSGPSVSSSESLRLWSGRFVISPGAHQILLRVDGGEWRVPTGMPSVEDSFGGTAGLLVLP